MRVPVPLQINIDRDKRLVHTAADGVILLPDILAYLDKVAAEGCMPFGKLFDATGARFELSDDDMMVLGARVSAYAAMDPRGPIALVVGSDADNVLGQRFANLGGAQRPIRLFRTMDPARTWLARETSL
jgi:hypothetical protein